MNKTKIFLNDADFTQVFKDILVNNSASDACTFIDMNFKYLFANQIFLDHYGYKMEDIVGLEYKDIQQDQEFASVLRELTVLSFKNKSFVRRVLAFKNTSQKLIDLVIDPVINPYTGNYVGSAAYISMVMMSNPLKEIIKKINKKINIFIPNAQSKSSINGIDLTEREHEILLLLSIGKSYKEIAVILTNLHGQDFSPTSISNITYRKLFDKFNVVTASGLIEKAIALDITSNIPASFI
ncbi:MAG: PAS domain-containing protein [Burkholderiales bacterium]|nr:PAS domain-containing protein [Burkholderiales bacterium]